MRTSIIFTCLIVSAGFLCNIIIASIASKSIGNPAYFGDLFSFVQMEFILGIFLSCGVDLAIDKFFPKFIYKNKHKAIEVYNRLYFSIISMMFLFFVITILSIYAYCYFVKKIDFIENKNLFIDNLYLLFTSFFIAINCYFCKILRVYGHIIFATANYLFTPVVIFLIMVCIFSVKQTYHFAQLYSLSWIVTFCLTLLLLHKYVTVKFMVNPLTIFKSLYYRFKYIKRMFRKRILKDSIYLLLSSTSDNSFGMAVVTINIVLAKSGDVGLAAAINTVCLLYAVVIKTLSSLYRPSLKLKMLQDKNEAVRFIKIYTKAGLFLALIITLIYLLFGEQILVMIYGHDYARGYIPLVITSVAFCLVDGFAIHKMTLELYKSKSIAKLVMITNLASLLLVVIFGLLYGLIGAISGFLIGRLAYVIIINQKFSKLLVDLKRG